MVANAQADIGLSEFLISLTHEDMMKKTMILIYGVASYLLFLAVFLYAVGFIGNFAVPTTLDGLPAQPFWQALLVNLGLLSVFALQHSGMARKGFKRWIQKYIPESAERSTYVLLSNGVMILLFAFWQPMGGVIWHADAGLAQTALITLYMFGWSLVLVSTFLINHFHLFGLQQVWYQFKGKTIPPGDFRTPSLYRFVRHPLYVGWIVVMWAAPTMTVAHLVFALMSTAYIMVAIQFEEQDLREEFGEQYENYQQQVPMIIPAVTARAPKQTIQQIQES